METIQNDLSILDWSKIYWLRGDCWILWGEDMGINFLENDLILKQAPFKTHLKPF